MDGMLPCFGRGFTFIFSYTAFAIVQVMSGKRENRSGILARDRSISDTYWSKQRRGLFGWVCCLQVLRFTYLHIYFFKTLLRFKKKKLI